MDAVKFLEERKRMFKNGNPVPGLGIDINYNETRMQGLSPRVLDAGGGVK